WMGFCLLLLTTSIASHAQRGEPQFASNNETRIFSLINRERERSGLAALQWSDKLAEFARDYSRTMARDGNFGHIDGNGDDVVGRAKHSHLKGWQKIGENLFVCDPTSDIAKLAIYGWMHSPTHKDNLLDPEWRGTGIGIAYSPSGEIYITEIFADR